MAAFLSLLVLAQSYVFPVRPGKNEVRYYDFAWRQQDLQPGDGAGVRLYFYEREREIAEIAAHAIGESYRALRRHFRYTPSRQVPYVLYSSHREFRSTNLFTLNEFVLGVTSPQDLKMSLPYWGEYQRFREVSTHEMAHQFTIQKVADAEGARGGALAGLAALSAMPLWFIEGIAEYYAHGPAGEGGEGEEAIDEETWGFLRDLVNHPDPLRGWMLVNFFEDHPGSFVHTYKLGQARVAWMVERYGEARLMSILEGAGAAPASAPEMPSVGTGAPPRPNAFAERVAAAFSTTPEDIDREFQAWIRRRVYQDYLEARTSDGSLEGPVTIPGEPDDYVAAPGGKRILYRAVERGTGASTLWLADPDLPAKAKKVVSDQRPGVESLHPVDRRVMALGQKRLVFAAQSGPSDRLHVVDYEAVGGGGFELGERTVHELVDEGIIEVSDPALSPDEQEVAFVALTREGYEDVFVMPVREGPRRLRRLTRDRYSERDLCWTAEGLVLATDRTPSGRYGLAALDPVTGARRLVAHDPVANLRKPAAIPNAIAYERRGPRKTDLYKRAAGRLVQLTDLAARIESPAAAPDGLWALVLKGGRRQLVRVPSRALLEEAGRLEIDPASDAVSDIPVLPIPKEAPTYRPFTLESWSLQGAAGGVSTGALGGLGLLFADVLRDRRLAVLLNIWGSLDLTDAFLIYEDRASRLLWRTGAYHTFREQRDLTFPESLNFYLQREYGGLFAFGWPFDPFQRVELAVTLGGVTRQDFTDVDGTLSDAWNALSGGADWRARAALAYGWDSTVLHPLAPGPLAGASVWLELGQQYLPARTDLSTYATLDAQKYFRLASRATFVLRQAAGGSFGRSRFRDQFFLSSYDNLRGFQWGDYRLLGSYYSVTQAELRFPLDGLVRVAIVPSIQFVAGLDFGAVAEKAGDLWDRRTLAGVLGANMLFGPFYLRLHFGRPLDVGGLVPNQEWITSFSLALFGM